MSRKTGKEPTRVPRIARKEPFRVITIRYFIQEDSIKSKANIISKRKSLIQIEAEKLDF